MHCVGRVQRRGTINLLYLLTRPGERRKQAIRKVSFRLPVPHNAIIPVASTVSPGLPRQLAAEKANRTLRTPLANFTA